MRYLLAFGLALCTINPLGARTLGDKKHPNIVIILTDDVGYADFGCYGNKKVKTPNLDRMAKEGIRFTSFYVTQGICSASRAALLTGKYSNRTGILGAL